MPKQLVMDFEEHQEPQPATGMLLWYDPRKERTTAEKIADAAQRYRDNTGQAANVALCNPGDAGHLAEVAVGGAVIRVKAAGHVRPNNVLCGRE